jgi:hypothetical protein
VLINRNHTYTDLYLPISVQEKRWFDAIDGNRTLGAILATLPASGQGPALRDAARGFFERLWCWDQLVFDTSCSTIRQQPKE